MPRLDRLKTYVKQLNPIAIGVELLIVFVGVYLAFALADARETRLLDDRRDRVMTLLHDGFVRYDQLFTGIAQFHETHNAEVRAELAEGGLPDFGDQLYVAPQYPIDVITYVLTTESFDVFDVELYVPLTAYANRVQQLMSVEAEITDLADQYVPLAAGTSGQLRQEQRQIAYRYYLYLEARRRITADLAEQSRALTDRLSDSP